MNSEISKLWISVIGLFYIGDLATTGIGIWMGGMTESNMVYQPILNKYGLVAMLFALGAMKVIIIVSFAWTYGRMESIYRYCMPLALILTGVAATAWNGYLILIYIL